MIHTQYGFGTAFSIDVDGREYWFTAKHVFTGRDEGPAGEYSERTATASLLSENIQDQGQGATGDDKNWVTLTFRTIDPGRDIDILVLVPDHLLIGGAEAGSLAFGSVGVGYGADCEFLGFPYGQGWKTQWESGRKVWLPFVKHCTVSGRMRTSLDIWVLDGINNHGFSGGPVVFATGPAQKVFAVVSGYYTEPLDVLPSKAANASGTAVPPPPKLPHGKVAPKKQVVNANTGFIVAFDLQPAIDAIRANPIGPLRSSK